MAVKIRLMRIGAKGRPFYRVVAVDERKKRTGAYLDLLGTYNPLTQPKEISLNQPKIDQWIKKGAIMSDGFLRIIGKAPLRKERGPKKTVAPKASGPKQNTTVKEEPSLSEQTSPETENQTPSDQES